MSQYIKLKKGKYYVRNDLVSFLIFYRYFLFRIQIPYYIYSILNPINILVIKLFFHLRLNTLLKTSKLNDKSLVIRKSKAKNPSIVKLIKKKNGKLYIQKFNSHEILKKEVDFYEKYKENRSRIKVLPVVLKKNYLEIEFLEQESLLTMLLERRIKRKDFFNIVEIFIKELDLFYAGKEKCLIHGDLFPSNIYYLDGVFTLIDYSDSEIYFPKFDMYIFLKNVFKFYGIEESKIKSYFVFKEIEKFEKHQEEKNVSKY